MRRFLLVLAAGIAMPAAAQEMDHATHGHAAHAEPPPQSGARGTDLPPGNAPPPPVMHDRSADLHHDPAAMAAAERTMMAEHASPADGQVQFNLAEYQARKGRDGYRWEAEAWWGDLDRLMVRSQGEGGFGKRLESAEVQGLYSRALDPWWNLQFGIRQDFGRGPSPTHAVAGIEGLAPYLFDLQGMLFLSDKGDLHARLEGSHDQRLTQALILQSRLELNLAAQDIPAQGIGSGLGEVEVGLRLRYEIAREFAPYVGISWAWKTGRTADYARAEGEDTDAGGLVVGIRAWF